MKTQAQELKELAGIEGLGRDEQFDLRKALKAVDSAEDTAQKVKSEVYFYPDEPHITVTQIHVKVLTMRDESVFVLSLKVMKEEGHSETFAEAFDNYELAEKTINRILLAAREVLEPPNNNMAMLLKILEEAKAAVAAIPDSSPQKKEAAMDEIFEKLNQAGVEVEIVEIGENGNNQEASQNAPSKDEITH